MTRYVCPACHQAIVLLVPIVKAPICSNHLRPTVMVKEWEKES